MEKIDLEKKGYKIIVPEIKKKRLDDKQLKASFKNIYGKEPTENDFRQFKGYYHGN